MSDVQPSTLAASPEVIASPWVDGAIVYGAFLAIFLVTFWIAGHVPRRSPSVAIAFDVVPYLLIFLVVLWQRSRRHPYFPIGSPRRAFERVAIVWLLAAGIATYTAFRAGVFGSHSIAWQITTFLSDPWEAVVEEFAFRGAILTALNATRLGTRALFGFRLGTLVSAFAFASVHLLALLAGMPPRDAPLFLASALLAGLVFGYLYQRTQNLWYGIFIHALGNFSQVLP